MVQFLDGATTVEATVNVSHETYSQALEGTDPISFGLADAGKSFTVRLRADGHDYNLGTLTVSAEQIAPIARLTPQTVVAGSQPVLTLNGSGAEFPANATVILKMTGQADISIPVGASPVNQLNIPVGTALVDGDYEVYLQPQGVALTALVRIGTLPVAAGLSLATPAVVGLDPDATTAGTYGKELSGWQVGVTGLAINGNNVDFATLTMEHSTARTISLPSGPTSVEMPGAGTAQLVVTDGNPPQVEIRFWATGVDTSATPTRVYDLIPPVRDATGAVTTPAHFEERPAVSLGTVPAITVGPVPTGGITVPLSGTIAAGNIVLTYTGTPPAGVTTPITIPITAGAANFVIPQQTGSPASPVVLGLGGYTVSYQPAGGAPLDLDNITVGAATGTLWNGTPVLVGPTGTGTPTLTKAGGVATLGFQFPSGYVPQAGDQIRVIRSGSRATTMNAVVALATSGNSGYYTLTSADIAPGATITVTGGNGSGGTVDTGSTITSSHGFFVLYRGSTPIAYIGTTRTGGGGGGGGRSGAGT